MEVMLSTSYRLQLTDILCRMITTDGVPVTLEERVWMNKLIERNPSARAIHDTMINAKTPGIKWSNHQ